MNQADGREPVLVLVGVSDAARDRFARAVSSLEGPARLETVPLDQAEFKIREVCFEGDLRLVVVAMQASGEHRQLIDQIGEPDRFVKVPIVLLSESPDAEETELAGATSCLTISPGDDADVLIERTVRYWMELNMVPLKNR